MLAAAVAAGAVLGLLVTVTPLLLVAIALASVTILAVRRDLAADERRAVTAIIVGALAARVPVVCALAAAGLPLISDQSGGLVFGDEAYVYKRAIRTRNVLIGLPATKLDYLTMSEPYTRSRFTTWMAWTQTAFGPSPFATRLLNGVLFVAAGAMLYRIARRGFGPLAALGGLALLLFVPSALFWSVSLLKESVFFLLTTAALTGALFMVRAPSWHARGAAALLFVASVWLLSDLRVGAAVVTGGGALFGLLMWWATATRTRTIALALAAIVLTITTILWPPLSSRFLRQTTVAASQHFGHVGTVGHAYKTLDERFYPYFRIVIEKQPMTRGEAVRFLARSAFAFVTVPLPWRAVGSSELLLHARADRLVRDARAGRRGNRRRLPPRSAVRLPAARLHAADGRAARRQQRQRRHAGAIARARHALRRVDRGARVPGHRRAIRRPGRTAGGRFVSLVDADGRVFGRVNLVDALCVVFVLGLVPAAYVSWLLFRPAAPQIRSVEPSAITPAEQRIAAGLPIRLKVKVHGDHLAPLLRAQIDRVPAIGFTFETPNSADVIIGYNVPVGTHDLVLYDGVQEVARARGAITIARTPAAPMRAIGTLVQLDEARAKGLHVGQQFSVEASARRRSSRSAMSRRIARWCPRRTGGGARRS